MAKAVHAARLAVGAFFEFGHAQHPVEVKTQHRQHVMAVAQLGHEQVVVGLGQVAPGVVFDDLLVNAHRRVERHDGFAVAFGLGQGQAQVGVVAAHHLDVLVLEGFQVTGANKAVHHKANRPAQVGRHDLFFEPHFVLDADFGPALGVAHAAQAARLADDAPVFGGRKRPARLGNHLHLGKIRQRFELARGHRVAQHLAHGHQVLADGDSGMLVAHEVDEVEQALVGHL